MAAWLAVAPTGCALLFQEHLPATYAVDTEPRCSTAPGWYLWDALNVAGDAALVVIDEQHDNTVLTSAGVTVAVTSGLIHLASLYRGYGWVGECEDARRAHDNYVQRPPATRTQRGAPLDLGFFCSSSPTVIAASLCKRNEPACERERAAALSETGDMGTCELIDVAHCFAPDLGGKPPRCSSSAAACAAQRDAVAGNTSNTSTIGECVEVR